MLIEGLLAIARGEGVGVNRKPVRAADQIRAYELLLAYGWGKPAAFVPIEGAIRWRWTRSQPRSSRSPSNCAANATPAKNRSPIWGERSSPVMACGMGILAAMLGMFENRISLFPNAAFEEEDGEPVLVVQGDVDNIRFPRRQNRSRGSLWAAGKSANAWRYRNSYGTAGSRYSKPGQGCGSSLASGRRRCAKERSRSLRPRESLDSSQRCDSGSAASRIVRRPVHRAGATAGRWRRTNTTDSEMGARVAWRARANVIAAAPSVQDASKGVG